MPNLNIEQWKPVILDATTHEFIDELNSHNAPSLAETTVLEARAAHARGQDIPVLNLPADIEDRTIAAGPNKNLLIRVVRPKGDAGTLPAVMYFHGGGFVLGDRHDWDRLLRDLAPPMRPSSMSSIRDLRKSTIQLPLRKHTRQRCGLLTTAGKSTSTPHRSPSLGTVREATWWQRSRSSRSSAEDRNLVFGSCSIPTLTPPLVQIPTSNSGPDIF